MFKTDAVGLLSWRRIGGRAESGAKEGGAGGGVGRGVVGEREGGSQ